MSVDNPYESPKVQASVAQDQEKIPEAVLVEDQLVNVEKRIKSRRTSLSIGTLMMAGAMILFGIGPSFAISLIHFDVRRIQLPSAADSSTLLGNLLVWGVIVSGFAIWAFWGSEKTPKVLGYVHLVSICVEVLVYGSIFGFSVWEAFRELAPSGLSFKVFWDRAVERPMEMLLPILLIAVGGMLHLLFYGETRRLGELHAEREKILDGRQATQR